MSFKAKVIVTLRYGASITVALLFQWMIHRHLRKLERQGMAVPRWLWGLFWMGNAALLLVPVDWALGLTLPRWLYVSVLAFGITYQVGSALAFLFALLLERRVGTEGTDARKRIALGAAGAALLGAILSVQSLYGGLRRPIVVRRRLRIRGLRGTLHVVHVTDFHTGYFMDGASLREMSRMILDMEPDIVVLTGDQLHGSHAPFVEDLRRGLKELGRHGRVFAVAGNHDHRLGVEPMFRALREVGIRPLQNENITIETTAGPVTLVGIDDLWYGGDLRRALRGWTAEHPTILLSHRPDVFDEAAALGIQLTLAGHTHGGQINLFGLSPSLMETPYTYGVYEKNGRYLHVSCGVGTTGVPMRFGTTPEIVELILEG